jgi:hypothetical protein
MTHRKQVPWLVFFFVICILEPTGYITGGATLHALSVYERQADEYPRGQGEAEVREVEVPVPIKRCPRDVTEVFVSEGHGQGTTTRFVPRSPS